MLPLSDSAKGNKLVVTVCRYDLPGSLLRDPRTSDKMHEINNLKETKYTLFTYLHLGWLQVIVESLEFGRSPSGIRLVDGR